MIKSSSHNFLVRSIYVLSGRFQYNFFCVSYIQNNMRTYNQHGNINTPHTIWTMLSLHVFRILGESKVINFYSKCKKINQSKSNQLNQYILGILYVPGTVWILTMKDELGWRENIHMQYPHIWYSVEDNNILLKYSRRDNSLCLYWVGRLEAMGKLFWGMITSAGSWMWSQSLTNQQELVWTL